MPLGLLLEICKTFSLTLTRLFFLYNTYLAALYKFIYSVYTVLANHARVLNFLLEYPDCVRSMPVGHSGATIFRLFDNTLDRSQLEFKKNIKMDHEKNRMFDILCLFCSLF